MPSSDPTGNALAAASTELALPADEAVDGEAAKGKFKARTREWAERLDVRVTSIAVRPLKTKWASCSARGRLTFDTQLLAFSPDLQDYVIVHELLHFSVPNHGRLWKSLMRAHLGEYEAHETELRAAARKQTCEWRSS